MIKKFEVKQTANDKYGRVWTIVRRTAKSVWAVDDLDKEIKRFKIMIATDEEYFMPHGRYSQAPCVYAKQENKMKTIRERQREIELEILPNFVRYGFVARKDQSVITGAETEQGRISWKKFEKVK